MNLTNISGKLGNISHEIVKKLPMQSNTTTNNISQPFSIEKYETKVKQDSTHLPRKSSEIIGAPKLKDDMSISNDDILHESMNESNTLEKEAIYDDCNKMRKNNTLGPVEFSEEMHPLSKMWKIAQALTKGGEY